VTTVVLGEVAGASGAKRLACLDAGARIGPLESANQVCALSELYALTPADDTAYQWTDSCSDFMRKSTADTSGGL